MILIPPSTKIALDFQNKMRSFQLIFMITDKFRIESISKFFLDHIHQGINGFPDEFVRQLNLGLKEFWQSQLS